MAWSYADIRTAALTLAVVAAAALSLLVGGTPLRFGDVAAQLFHPHGTGVVNTIVWQLRLPRVCIAATVGASLALCGAMLQGMLRNPLVDPYLTGVSAAAAAAVAIAILLGIAAPATPAIGFLAGLGAALLVAALARRGGGLDGNRLILAGVSLSTLFAAIVTLALVRARSNDYAGAIVAWLAGSMAGRGWHDLAITAPYVVIGVALAAAAIGPLNALRIGDLRARAVGVDVERAQWIILAGSSLLAASSVVLAGLVGFIGLLVPHLGRRLVGSDARALLPASAAIGATLCMVADAICRRIVAPAELPIGVLLALIGVPAFLYLYLRPSVRGAP
ncbi:MAG TPA: iron ABC transporter permease [Candidatus Baltobacteraceae bacterium]|nr:iron ABC transporter permease [Candidatus Baltobacteraceae bacterium]